ncbi:hypothetical protein ACFWH4_01635 [Streptomyces sp. NPDC127091]|uniref:hypothetical protein n=1 Tax=Streptomyces sp. NPDC127091 TaxID=3347134 RepID=UPI003660E9A5
MDEPTQHTVTEEGVPAAATAREQVLAALTLPALDDLTEAQVRGATCVWDGIPLTLTTAVNLGPRKKKRPGGTYDWFPRSCKRCAGEKAYIALFIHGRDCADCWKGPDCPFAVAVRQLLREG